MTLRPTSDVPHAPSLADEAASALADKVRCLSRPDFFPHRPHAVTPRETHMSWVFMAGDRVFKLKKPVRYPFLDFSTLAAREHFCREEVRLNRRLAPDVYRGVVALTRDPSGELRLGGAGEVVDWLVEMKRLPTGCMLDTRLKEGSLGESDIQRLAEVLAEFYRTAEHPPVDPGAFFLRFVEELEADRVVLTRSDLPMDRARVEAVLARIGTALADVRGHIEERARSGHIVDGHGDLRPEHVCMTEPIVVFDCLEFSRELRLVDPFDDMAFLGMECACLGAPWLGPALASRVAKRLGVEVPHDLLPAYTALHAALRARLSLAHLLDPVPREPAKWAPLARHYLDLAEKALN